mgnify:CR=1 FL=1
MGSRALLLCVLTTSGGHCVDDVSQLQDVTNTCSEAARHQMAWDVMGTAGTVVVCWLAQHDHSRELHATLVKTAVQDATNACRTGDVPAHAATSQPGSAQHVAAAALSAVDSGQCNNLCWFAVFTMGQCSRLVPQWTLVTRLRLFVSALSLYRSLPGKPNKKELAGLMRAVHSVRFEVLLASEGNGASAVVGNVAAQTCGACMVHVLLGFAVWDV